MRSASSIALGTLLLTSCTSESRLWRLSRFSSADESDPQRFNAWPLVYADRTGASVLWPLMDFDDRGFAVRPLVSRDDAEWDILFPLSHFDVESGDGWLLNAYSLDDNVGFFPLFNFGPHLGWFLPGFWRREDGELANWGVVPIAYGDRRTGNGFFLTAYSYQEYRGIFPLCHFGPGFNFAGPAWWSRSGEDVTTRGLLPVAGFGDFNYVGPVWWRSAKEHETSSFGLFPLFTWAGLRQIGPAWWTRPDAAGEGWFGAFPLVWGERGGGTLVAAPFYVQRGGFRAVLPFYGQDVDEDGELRVALVPPTWWETRGETERHFLFPFYAHVADEKGDFTAFPPFIARRTSAGRREWYTPLGNGWSAGGSTGLNVYPLYWSARAPDASRHMLAPLYLYRERGSERLLLTPLGGRAWDSSGATRFVNFLGPVYHHSVGPDSETISVLWPLFEREHRGEETSTRAFPLFDLTTTPRRTDAWALAGLGRYVSESGSSSLRLWPLYGGSDAEESPDLLFDFALVGHREHGEEWSQHVFPLYAARGDGKESTVTGLLGLARVGTTQLGSAWRLWPLASGSSDPEAEGWIDRATLFRRERRGDASRGWLFPLYVGERGPEVSRDDLLLSALRRKRTDAGSAWRLWPLLSTTTGDGLEDPLDSVTLIGVHPHPAKTHVHVGTSLVFGFDRYGEEKRSWDARTLLFFDVGHQEFPARTSPASEQPPGAAAEPGPSAPQTAAAPVLRERDYAGFLFDWFLIESRVLETPDGSRHDESHWRLPLIHEYERTADRKEWDLLCYAIHSKETPDEEKFSVLGYAWRSERRGETTRRDIFPFVTYDTAPDSTRFSFLWRLFRYERRGEKRGGHVLFIPWGES